MKCKEIISWLEEQYPVSYAESWDNVGLLVGRDDKEVSRVFLALDLTEEVLGEALQANADLIITHHPMIFGGIKKITNLSSEGRRILGLVGADISYYAMHTNYDILGMADVSAAYLHLSGAQVLSVTTDGEKQEGFGRVGDLPREMSLKECALYVKECLGISDVKVYGEPSARVRRAAVCTGAGKSMVKDALAAGAEVYVTGDIDHHTGIDTWAAGMAVIDAGHYGTEYIFMEAMKKALGGQFPALEIKTARVKTPYQIY